jgi:hypothetical protein
VRDPRAPRFRQRAVSRRGPPPPPPPRTVKNGRAEVDDLRGTARDFRFIAVNSYLISGEMLVRTHLPRASTPSGDNKYLARRVLVIIAYCMRSRARK